MSLSIRAARGLFPSTIQRTFTMSALRSAEGDVGAPRFGGAASGDAFTRRERASEDYYVKQHEKEQLAALKKKIADQEAQLAKDRGEVEKITKKNGGS